MIATLRLSKAAETIKKIAYSAIFTCTYHFPMVKGCLALVWQLSSMAMGAVKRVKWLPPCSPLTFSSMLLSWLPTDITTHNLRRTQAVIDHDSLRSVLEEALLRTIQDIDSEFSKQALDKGYVSGSTATVALLFEGQLLVANVGDSKALLCSKYGDSSKQVYVEELTRDHHPDREDEKTRIEAAGGFITRYGVPRVNGILALSRAIGDVYFKRFGVTAEAEVTSWKAFTSENSYLVVASDGVFETLTPKDVCRLLHNEGSSSLPERIIRRALETGSMDNLSAIVISHLVSCCGRESTESQPL
ncbi:putative protein phosphatase 2C 76 isoform X4 [Salvia splendens]|uniref:putative protein phosphatase 2C 76 isoform X4 n=1 Tax=Salvia splendens TaxID=180675 RepID=UPI001C26D66B|nr:putative protein phosphatase 2C 76 isoform X4 [Salvia splendens]